MAPIRRAHNATLEGGSAAATLDERHHAAGGSGAGWSGGDGGFWHGRVIGDHGMTDEGNLERVIIDQAGLKGTSGKKQKRIGGKGIIRMMAKPDQGKAH